MTNALIFDKKQYWTMLGVCVFGLRISDHTEKSPKFPLYFESIFEELALYQWIVAWDCFFCPIEEKENEEFEMFFDNLEIAQEANFWSCKTPLMPHLAPFVRDAWNDLFGFWELPNDPTQWCKRYWCQTTRRRFVKESTQVAFMNIDGFFWEALFNSEELFVKVRKELQKDPAFRVVEISHDTCFGL